MTDARLARALEGARTAGAVAFVALSARVYLSSAVPGRCEYDPASVWCGFLWAEWEIAVAAGLGLLAAVVLAAARRWVK